MRIWWKLVIRRKKEEDVGGSEGSSGTQLDGKQTLGVVCTFVSSITVMFGW
jgi:hypothetical protein